MADFQPGDDYSHQPVPESDGTSAYHIAVIIIGGTIAVPGFLMASKISYGAGFYPGLIGFILGCQILAVTGVFAGMVGARSKLSTYLILRYSFGSIGYRFPNFLIALVMFCWFAILCNLFGAAAQEIVSIVANMNMSKQWLAVLGGLIMVGVTIYGFHAIEKMALLMVPLLALILLYGAYRSLTQSDLGDLNSLGDGTLGIGGAMSIVIGAYSGGIVTLPDYVRYARNQKRALTAVYLALGVSFPLVLTVTAIPSILSGEQDLIKIMLSLGVGVGALIVLIFSTMSSNVGMLYSVGLSVAASFKQVKFWWSVALFGVLATILSTFDVVTLFIPYISILGISIPSLCGIYICDFFFVNGQNYSVEKLSELPRYNYSAFIAWGTGFAVGALSVNGIITLTTVSAFDSMICAALCYIMLAVWRSHLNPTRG
jgi:cytosine permease